MPDGKRSELEQQIVDALIDSQAINFESLAGVLAKYGAQAARTGIDLGVVINRHVIWGCIPPDPFTLGSIGQVGKG